MPRIMPPIEDEIDLTGEDLENPETQNELPDEVVIEDNENASEQEEENNEAETVDEKPADETSDQQEPENSSLTSEPEAQPDTDTPPAPEELSDDRVLTYLSEKLGREVKSLEDLTPAEAAETQDPFNGDEELKAIAEWKERTNRPVSEYYKFQKDYEKMEPLEVVRENLQLLYPDFTPEEIAMEMEEYVVDEDIDTDNEAARKRLKLKKAAVSAKENLNQYKSTFDTPVEPKLSKEQKEAISFYEKYQEQTDKVKAQTEQYDSAIKTEVSNLKSIPLNLDKDLSIDLNLSKEEIQGLPDLVKNMPHWYNEDGSHNHSAIVKDAVKIANFDKAVKLAYEQGVNKGIEQEDKDSRNVDFTGARKGQPDSEDEIVVEGADGFLSGGLKFGRRR